jgi:Kef-type K+ transport systems, membrane components
MSVEEVGAFSVERFLLVFALILVASKVFGEIAERIKQPAVLGELVAGVILGGSVLALVPSIPGETGYEIFRLLAEVGVAILLFEIGLETDLKDMVRVGIPSTLVAVVGVILPFFFGFLSIIAFEKFGVLGDIDPAFATLIAITVGATLTATSVGITARVLSDINRLHTEEARIVLGAAVIDDVLGLIILAVVSGLIEAAKQGTGGGVSAVEVGIITLKAFGFLFAAILIGNLASKKLFDLVNKMRVRGVLILSALSFAFIFAYLAKIVGLAPIVGAFAAGLVLARVNQFDLIEERLKPVSDVFTPIFFIIVGAAVNVSVFNPLVPENVPILLIALVLFVVAVAGKFASGWAVFKKKIKKSVIGVGMIPRGEVGLIFAQMGLTSGVFDSKLFSAMTAMVMLTTFIAPPLLKITFAGGEEEAFIEVKEPEIQTSREHGE